MLKLIKAKKIRLPDKHQVVHKGENFFHMSYTGVEAFTGHGPLQWLAAGAFTFIVLDVVLHLFVHE